MDADADVDLDVDVDRPRMLTGMLICMASRADERVPSEPSYTLIKFIIALINYVSDRVNMHQ